MDSKFDSYQVTFQVDICGEERLLIKKCGVSAFGIKTDLIDNDTNSDSGCGCNKTDNSDSNDDSSNKQICCTISMPNAVVLDVVADKCDCAHAKATFTIYVNLPCKHNKISSRKFTIFVKACGKKCEKDVATLKVNPLDPNIITTATVSNCTKFNITRVPTRIFNIVTKHCIDYALCMNNNKLIKIAETKDVHCPKIHSLQYKPNTLQIIFPLTEDILALDPETNNFDPYENNKQVIVKVVSRCPEQYSFPALLLIDRVNCNAQLEISKKFIKRYVKYIKHNKEEIKYMFGPDGRHTQLIDHNIDFFNYLTQSSKFSVFGPNNSDECSVDTNNTKIKPIFRFSICIDPYKSFCVESCGCKAGTILPPCATASNGFTINSDVCYLSYEFSKYKY